MRQRKGKRYHSDCITSTVKFGGGKIQGWGCMSTNVVGSLKVVDGRLDSAKYVRLISNSLKDDGRRLCGEDFLFQQDEQPVTLLEGQ